MDAFFVSDVATATLHDLLVQETAAAGLWLYAESEHEVSLRVVAATLDGDPPGWQAWEHGRVFGSQYELAWWREDNNCYRLRLLTESSERPSGVDWGEAETWTPWGMPGRTLLYGSLDQDRMKETGEASWSEARIPRYLLYPVEISSETIPENSNVLAILETQAYARNGIVGLHRLVAVTAEIVSQEAADVG